MSGPTSSEPDEVSAAATAAGGAESPSEGEVEELRKQVAGLQEQLQQVEHDRPRGFWQRTRSPIAVILIIIGSILAPLSVMTVYLRNQVLSTDRYVSTVAPLGSDPAVQSLVAVQVTNQLFSRVDVKSEIEDVLPHRASFLAGPLTSALHSVTLAAANHFTHSDRFPRLWVAINTIAHRQIVGVLTGKAEGAISADRSGKVTLNLHTVATRVQQDLVKRGLTIFKKIPADKVGGTIVLFKAKQLVKAQRGARALNSLAYLLPILSLACYGGAIAVARRRRRYTVAAGAALAASMAFLAVGLGIGRGYIVNAAGQQISPKVVGDFYDTMLRNVHVAVRIIFFVGLLVALVGWLVGPARPAVALRRAVARGWAWIVKCVRGRRWTLGPAGAWVDTNRGWVQVAIAALALIILVWWTPGWLGALVLVLIAGAAILLLQGIGSEHRKLATTPAGGPAVPNRRGDRRRPREPPCPLRPIQPSPRTRADRRPDGLLRRSVPFASRRPPS
jgi:hypothetical protein